jgi:hypothetical protein
VTVLKDTQISLKLYTEVHDSDHSQHLIYMLCCTRRSDFVFANEPDTPMQGRSRVHHSSCLSACCVSHRLSLISNTVVMEKSPIRAGGYSPSYPIGFIVRLTHHDCVMTWHDGGKRPRIVPVLAEFEWRPGDLHRKPKSLNVVQ